MATVNDIEKQIAALEKEYSSLNNAAFDPASKTYTAAGQKYSEGALKKRASDVQSDINTLKKALKPVKDAEAKVKSAAATGPGQKLDAQGQKILEQAKAELKRVKETDITVSGLKTVTAPTTQAKAPVITDGRTTAATTPATSKPTTVSSAITTTAPPAATAKAAPTTTKKATPKKVAAKKPSATTTPDTTADTWKSIIQEEFGSLWDVYNENPDVKAVIDKSVKEGWYNDETKLTAGLTNTNWFRTTQSSARQFAIRQSTDPATVQSEIDASAESIRQIALNKGTALSDEAVTRLATDNLKYKYTPAQLSNAIGSEVVATAKSGGPTAVAELSRGNIGTTLRAYADSYAIKPSDTMIEQWTANILSGSQSEENFQNMIQENARSLYKSLQPQIDKGMDVKTATAMYTNQASRILGIDESQIDWTDAKWNKALNYQDPKTNEYRVMDASEWTRYLRSQPEWQNTDDAKNLYRTAAFTLAQAFGRTT